MPAHPDPFCPCCQEFTGTHNGHCSPCYFRHLELNTLIRDAITTIWGTGGLDQFDAHIRNQTDQLRRAA